MPAKKLLLACTALIGATVVPTTANSAVSVIGTGLSRICYEAAESGRATDDGFGACDRALSDQPLAVRDRAATHVNRGILHMRRKKLTEAIGDYEKAIKFKPDLAEAYVNKGIALVHLGGRDGEAINLISQGLDLNPIRPEVAYYTRGIANELLGRTRAAYDDYRAAAALKPSWSDPQNQLKRFSVVSKPG